MILTKIICILNRNSCTTKLFITNKNSISYRNYPGGKEVGHVAKIISTLANNATKTPKINPNNLGPVKEKLPILIPPKIKKTNSIVEKYLPIYSAHKLHIPFVINNYPSPSISGFMTIPKNNTKLLIHENPYTQELANLKVRYFCIMYRCKPVETYTDILSEWFLVQTIGSLLNAKIFSKEKFIILIRKNILIDEENN